MATSRKKADRQGKVDNEKRLHRNLERELSQEGDMQQTGPLVSMVLTSQEEGTCIVGGEVLKDTDHDLIVEALFQLRNLKEHSYLNASALQMPLSRESFGIPRIDELTKKFTRYATVLPAAMDAAGLPDEDDVKEYKARMNGGDV